MKPTSGARIMVLQRDTLVVGTAFGIAAMLYMLSFSDLIAADAQATAAGDGLPMPALVWTERNPASAG
jgi:hypothetical protein